MDNVIRVNFQTKKRRKRILKTNLKKETDATPAIIIETVEEYNERQKNT